jgi:hypothetical protein
MSEANRKTVEYYSYALFKVSGHYATLAATELRDFFPPITQTENGLVQSFVRGLRVDDLSWFEKDIPMSCYYECILDTLYQVCEFLEKYGVLIQDRSSVNAFVVPQDDNEERTYRKKGGKWKVVQIDFESATDFTLPVVNEGSIRSSLGEPS